MNKTFFIALAVAGFATVGLSNSTSSNKVQASTVNVKSGDTLWGYSQKYDVSIDAIAKANNFELNKFMMWQGDKINIPDGKANEVGAKFNNHYVATSVASSTSYHQPVVKTPTPTQTYKQTANTTQSTQHKQVMQSNTTTSQVSGTYKVTFYDPAVLGATTMPGGLYSGVAANLSVFPKGTVLKISLSNGQTLYRTVNDTGTFALSNPNQLDVAMPNRSIPAAGVLSATVTVIK